MKIRKIILTSFFVAILLFVLLDSTMVTWQVLLPLFLLGLILVGDGEFPTDWWYLIIASQVLLLFYFGYLATPYAWLAKQNIIFGLAILATVLYIFTVTGLVLGATYGILRLLRRFDSR